MKWVIVSLWVLCSTGASFGQLAVEPSGPLPTPDELRSSHREAQLPSGGATFRDEEPVSTGQNIRDELPTDRDRQLLPGPMAPVSR